MLLRHVQVAVTDYLLNIIDISGCQGLGIEGIKNGVANHREVRRASRRKAGNLPEWIIYRPRIPPGA